MGMYDTIYPSYDLGPGALSKELQCKDLECCMSEYWIDPEGKLYLIDYSGTQDMVDNPDEDRGEISLPWTWIRNGNHGRVRPVYLSKTIDVYPTQWDCKYAPYPTLRICFRHGKIDWVENVTSERLGETYNPTTIGASF